MAALSPGAAWGHMAGGLYDYIIHLHLSSFKTALLPQLLLGQTFLQREGHTKEAVGPKSLYVN